MSLNQISKSRSQSSIYSKKQAFVTHGSVILEMFDDAGFAERMQTFGDGGGVDQVTLAQTTRDHVV